MLGLVGGVRSAPATKRSHVTCNEPTFVQPKNRLFETWGENDAHFTSVSLRLCDLKAYFLELCNTILSTFNVGACGYICCVTPGVDSEMGPGPLYPLSVSQFLNKGGWRGESKLKSFWIEP